MSQDAPTQLPSQKDQILAVAYTLGFVGDAARALPCDPVTGADLVSIARQAVEFERQILAELSYPPAGYPETVGQMAIRMAWELGLLSDDLEKYRSSGVYRGRIDPELDSDLYALGELICDCERRLLRAARYI